MLKLPHKEIKAIRQRIQTEHSNEPELVIADARYQNIERIAMQSLIWSPLSPISSHKISIQSDIKSLVRCSYLLVCHVFNVCACHQYWWSIAALAFEGGSEAIFIHGIQWLGATFNFLNG